MATPPPGNPPSWGQGTWLESKVDLSGFRGRRVKLRFLVTGIQGDGETYLEWFQSVTELSSTEDGWWIDGVSITDVFTSGIVDTGFNLLGEMERLARSLRKA